MEYNRTIILQIYNCVKVILEKILKESRACARYARYYIKT